MQPPGRGLEYQVPATSSGSPGGVADEIHRKKAAGPRRARSIDPQAHIDVGCPYANRLDLGNKQLDPDLGLDVGFPRTDIASRKNPITLPV